MVIKHQYVISAKMSNDTVLVLGSFQSQHERDTRLEQISEALENGVKFLKVSDFQVNTKYIVQVKAGSF